MRSIATLANLEPLALRESINGSFKLEKAKPRISTQTNTFITPLLQHSITPADFSI